MNIVVGDRLAVGRRTVLVSLAAVHHRYAEQKKQNRMFHKIKLEIADSISQKKSEPTWLRFSNN